MIYPDGYVLSFNDNSGLNDTISRLSPLSDNEQKNSDTDYSEVIRALRHLPPDEIVAALWRQVAEWSQNVQVDDMTAIVIKVEG